MNMAGTQPERPMILGNCISCNGLMRVPVTTDVTHVARCPHCEVRFPVQQLIASAIPAAEIVEGEVAEEFTPVVDRVRDNAEEGGEKPRTKFEVPKQLKDGAKHRRRRRRRSRGSDERKEKAVKTKGRSSSSPAKINASSVPLASTQSLASAESAGVDVIDEAPVESKRSRSSSGSTGSSGSSSSSRSSRSQSSGRRSPSRSNDDTADSSFIEWIKIALGGLIAFPLAYLGLMWILGLDPFGLAPTLNNVAPIIVPSSLIDEDTLPLSPEIEDFESDVDEGLPKPSLDPDEVRG